MLKVIGVLNMYEREEDKLKALAFENGAPKGGHALLRRNEGPKGKMLDESGHVRRVAHCRNHILIVHVPTIYPHRKRYRIVLLISLLSRNGIGSSYETQANLSKLSN